eukprot:7658178-Pyramimonas_sp.AAC.1
MAEYLAFALSCQAADRPTALHADVKGAINQFNRTAQEEEYRSRRGTAVYQAHRAGDDDANLDEDTKRITDDNVVADHSAAEGTRRHMAISSDFEERMERHQK